MSDDVATAIAMRLVENEVLVCVSSLVSTMAAGAHVTFTGARHPAYARTGLEDLQSACEQALELACPVDDWEEPAREAGWVTADLTSGMVIKPGSTDPSGQAWAADGWQEACDQDGLDPYQREVFEHWVVTSYLAAKLQALGEKVDTDFCGLCVWARTTTGQAIYMDGVFNAIAREISGEPSHE